MTVNIGPFLDSVDAASEEGLTLSQADVTLSKNGGAFAQKNETSSATSRNNSFYAVALNATDVDSTGMLTVVVKEAGALPVGRSFMVIPTAVYDGLFGSAGLPVKTDDIKGMSLATVADGTLGGYIKSLPNNKAIGALDGLPTVDANNRIAGIAGTVANTFDGLLNAVVEVDPNITMRQAFAYILAALIGDTTGMTTTTPSLFTPSGNVVRATAHDRPPGQPRPCNAHRADLPVSGHVLE